MLEDEVVEETPEEEPKEEDLSLEDEIKAAVEEHTEEDQPEDQPEENQEEELEAPEHWDEDLKNAFEGIESEEGREALLKQSKNLEKGYNSKREELSDQVKEYDRITSILAPWQDQMNASGLTAFDAISNVMNAYSNIQQNPVLGVVQIINSLDEASQDAILQQFTQDGKAADGYVDPDIQNLQDQMGYLNDQVQQTNQTSFDNERTRVNNQVELFSTAVGDDGQPLRPYFGEVQADMVQHINAGHSLEEAYDKSIWSNPSTRAKLMKASSEANATTQNATRKRTANRAAKASRNANSTSIPSSVTPERTLVEEIQYNMETQRRS
ncbi:MAG: hypothetical protein V3R25_10305 [Nitrosomonadaceae bacterium]